MLKKIYRELVEIKEGLQAIRSNLKSLDNELYLDKDTMARLVRKANRDIDARYQG